MLSKDTYLYELSYSWYEEYSPRLFTSTQPYDEVEWQAMCDSLLGLAVDHALELYESGAMYKSWLGWRNIVDCLSSLLEERGFVPVKPIKADYFGSCIIDSEREVGKLPPDSAARVIAYNKALKDEIM